MAQDDELEAVLQLAATRGNHELIRSGHVPDVHGRAEITNDIHAIDRVRERIEAQITALRLQLSRLESQKAVSNTMLSPVRVLLPELLSLIFEFALPDDWWTCSAGRRSLNFAEVCRTWRAIALSTPPLWNHITIDHQFPVSRWLPAVQRHLARSGQVPLHLKLMFNTSLRAVKWLSPVKEYLYPQSHRWKALTIDDLLEKFEYLEPYWPRHLPLLTHLHLINNSRSPPPFDLFEDAPITSLKITQLRTPECIPALPASWSITTLTINCLLLEPEPDFERFMGLFAECSSTVEHLDLACTYISRTPLSFSGGLPFPSLKTLKMSYHASRLCVYIIAPKLTTVTLRGRAISTQGRDAFDMNAFYNMLLHPPSRASLTSVTLSNFAGAMDPLINCLDVMPVVSYLEIKNAGREIPRGNILLRPLLGALIRGKGGDTQSMERLPRLTTLIMKFNGHGCAGVDLLRMIVSSRATTDIYEGKELLGLERLETDLVQDWARPLAPDLKQLIV